MSKKKNKLGLLLEYHYDKLEANIYEKADDMFNKTMFFINYWGLNISITPVSTIRPSRNKHGDYWIFRFILYFEDKNEEEYMEKLIKYVEPNKYTYEYI